MNAALYFTEHRAVCKLNDKTFIIKLKEENMLDSANLM